jgi:hypothetical protein
MIFWLLFFEIAISVQFVSMSGEFLEIGIHEQLLNDNERYLKLFPFQVIQIDRNNHF